MLAMSMIHGFVSDANFYVYGFPAMYTWQTNFETEGAPDPNGLDPVSEFCAPSCLRRRELDLSNDAKWAR